MTMAIEIITPNALAARLTDGSEIAVLDVRAEASFLAGHLLLAVNTPLDRLLDLAPGFVPRRSTPIVLCDGGESIAREAAERLGTAGYDQLLILDGGVPAWTAAGREVFETGYAMANCFGLAVQACYATPRIDGSKLMRRQAAGEPLVIVDSRPFEEFHAATVPGAVNLPVAELFHRIRDHLPDAGGTQTTVVVHCGGKTRGILGCQSLINAGLANPVVALDEGTMDWVLAGGRLEQGADRTAAPPSEAATASAVRAAEGIARHFGVRTLSPGELSAWRRGADRRTLYLVDVRSRAEYEAGHLPDARWIPGGQLAGCTEDTIATRNARLCLVDDDGARAKLTASWMMQAGWPEVAVLEGGLAGHDLASGPDPLAAPLAEPGVMEGVDRTPPDEAEILRSYRTSIAWRSGLPERFARDGTLSFALPPQAGT
jgi:rhodanese-related sulfurtransferase